MPSRSTMKSSLATWLTATTASDIGAGDGVPVYWRGEPRPRVAPSYIVAFLSSPATVGRDTTTWTYDATAADGSQMLQHQRGQRTATLEIRAYSSKTRLDLDAGEIIRRIRDRIQLTDWYDTFAAAGVKYARVLMDTDLTEISDDREYTVHQIDIRLNTYSLEAGSPTTYIGVVEAEVELDGPPPIWSGEIEV